ncbi:MAG: hypothetical protein AABZ33_02615 [Chloroflexota bacterium]
MVATSFPALARLLRSGALDAELAALVWILAEGGLPVHVAAEDPSDAEALARGLEDLVRPVSVLAGGSLDAVMAGTTMEKPLLGVVLVVDGGRLSAAHWVRPPLRDGAGHVRTQGPAVLATWDARIGRFEHFAWGVIPELAAVVGRKAGDFELEHQSRIDQLESMAAGPH